VVNFQVRNKTNQEQAFRIMSCSYNQHWGNDDKHGNVYVPGWNCERNGDMLVTLKPGESYSNVLPIVIQRVKPGDFVQFRMSFTPFRKEATEDSYHNPLGTYWSNEIKIKVEKSGNLIRKNYTAFPLFL
jgi:hypothetical protein